MSPHKNTPDPTTAASTSDGHGPPDPLPPHLKGLLELPGSHVSADGHPIRIYRLTLDLTESELTVWARHFRQHYCIDSQLDTLRSGTGLTRAEYLLQLAFPDKTQSPGPSIRAGDFAEILIADYVEYVLGYWVPRGKYADKAVRNESIKGVDIIGFKCVPGVAHSPRDSLLSYEVKAQMTGKTYSGALRTAIADSAKDHLRQAITLNATKRRLLDHNRHDAAKKVERFQDLSDRPYEYRSGAAAVLSVANLSVTDTYVCATSDHPNRDSLDLLVITADALMHLVHQLYARAANEA